MLKFTNKNKSFVLTTENGDVYQNGEYICTIGELKWMNNQSWITLTKPYHWLLCNVDGDYPVKDPELDINSVLVKGHLIDYPGGDKFVRLVYRFNATYWFMDTNRDGKIMFGTEMHAGIFERGVYVRQIHFDTVDEILKFADDNMKRRYGDDYAQKDPHTLKRIDLE